MSLDANQEKECVLRGYCFMRHQAEQRHANDVQKGIDAKFKSIKGHFETLCRQKEFVKKCLITIIVTALLQLFGAVWFIAYDSASTKERLKNLESTVAINTANYIQMRGDIYVVED